MKKILYKLAKAILNKQGYKIVLIKVQNGHIHIDGDKELLKYTDTEGFLFGKEPYIQRPLKAVPLVPLKAEPLVMQPKDWKDLMIPLTDKELTNLESLSPHGNSKVQKWEDYNG